MFKKKGDKNAPDMYAQSGLVTELMDKAPPKVLKITYAGNGANANANAKDANILDQNTGKENTPTQVRYQPLSIVWPDMKSDHFYTIIMIDPDMPSRSTPIEQKTQVLHWLMVNIPGAGVGGRQLAPYIGSGPPPGTGIHRYTFLVFDEGISPKDYTSVEPVDLVQIQKRVNWNFVQSGKPWTLRDFISWANMSLPIAGNFYQAQWDCWVDQLWKTFDQYYEVMCPEKTCEKVYECRKKCEEEQKKPKEHCETTCYYSENVKEITSPCKCPGKCK